MAGRGSGTKAAGSSGLERVKSKRQSSQAEFQVWTGWCWEGKTPQEKFGLGRLSAGLGGREAGTGG
jgi:hypothetical protein